VNADLARRHTCAACGEQVVHSTWPDGSPAVLDPRPRCAAVLVRGRDEVQIWPTTECMVEHSAVCVAGIVRRTLNGASVMSESPNSSGNEETTLVAAGGDGEAANQPV